MRKGWREVWMVLLVVAYVAGASYAAHLAKERGHDIAEQRIEIEQLQEKLSVLETERDRLQHELHYRNQRFIELTRDYLEVLEKAEEMEQVLQWDARQMVLTFYAPLAPDAVEGMDYSGDPRVTSSGEKTQIGLTVAAGPGIPFGTPVYIPGFGYREVHDRGGSVGPNSIDVAVATRSEAFRLGRVKQTVYLDVD